MKKYISRLLFFLQFASFSQVKNESYKSFSENNVREHFMIFVNDSVVKFSNIRTHMGGEVIISGNFKKLNDTIEISLPKLSQKDSIEIAKYQLSYLSNKTIKLYLTKSELIDLTNKTVYVKSAIYYKKYYRRKSLLYFEGKKIIIDRGITNGYGIIEEMPKSNRKFIKALQKQIENPDAYKSTIVRGLSAYQKYGLIGINGVIVTERK